MDEQEVRPIDRPRPWGKIRVGATSDARWRDVADDVERIDRLEAHRLGLEVR